MTRSGRWRWQRSLTEAPHRSRTTRQPGFEKLYCACPLTLTGSIWMVAAHGWDIAGAPRTGLRGAFVARPGQSPDPIAPPDIVGEDLVSVAYAILDAEHQSQT